MGESAVGVKVEGGFQWYACEQGRYALPYDAEERGMTILTVTAKGQVTLEKEFLEQLGIKPG